MLQRIRPCVTAALFAAVVGTPATLAAQKATGITGAWEFTREDPSHQRGLLIFTETHYSMMFVRGTTPRATYPENRTMTDAETLAAYRSITANSGSYRLKGDQLTVKAYVSNDPDYMGAWPNNDDTFTVRIKGNAMTWIKPGLLGLKNDVTLRKVQ